MAPDIGNKWLLERLKMHADNKTKSYMQDDCKLAATVIEALQEQLLEAHEALTEQQKADLDTVTYGNGFMLDGKRIPPDEVIIADETASHQSDMREALEKISFMGLDAGMAGVDLSYFYQSQLRNCISIATNALSGEKK